MGVRVWAGGTGRLALTRRRLVGGGVRGVREVLLGPSARLAVRLRPGGVGALCGRVRVRVLCVVRCALFGVCVCVCVTMARAVVWLCCVCACVGVVVCVRVATWCLSVCLVSARERACVNVRGGCG